MQLQPIPRRKNLISLTPLIDIVFILLVFFMLTSSFDRQTGLDLQPTSTNESQQSVREFQLITVTPAGLLLDDQKVIPLQDLSSWANQLDNEEILVLTADNQAVVQQLLSVLEILQPILGERLSLASLKKDESSDSGLLNEKSLGRQ